MMGCDWLFGWQGGSRTAPTGWLVGCIDGQVWVVDEDVAAVMGGLVVWLVGRFANRPYGLVGVFN